MVWSAPSPDYAPHLCGARMRLEVEPASLVAPRKLSAVHGAVLTLLGEQHDGHRPSVALPGVTVPSLADAPEGVVLTLGAALLVQVHVQAPTQREVSAVQHGEITLAIDRDGPAIVALAGMPPAFPRSACAAPWWSRREQAEVPAQLAGRVAGLAQVVLVRCADGYVAAMRTIGLTSGIAAGLSRLEAEARACGRDDIGWQRVREWTRTVGVVELDQRAARAALVTGVAGRG